MSRPSVLHFSTAVNDGGSGRAAWRIHSGLQALGQTSRMLAGVAGPVEPGDWDTVWGTRGLWAADRVVDRLTTRLGLQYVWLPSRHRVTRHPWVADADVIQLYNLHGGWFALPALLSLARGRPVVWRLSDMWPFTGHCAYAGDCERWRTGCGACPYPEAEPAIGVDTSALLWRMKRRIYADLNLTVVAPSRWIRDLAAASPLFAGRRIELIPNGLDLSVFRPIDRTAARTVLDIPIGAPVVLFAARNLDDPRKGADDALAAVRAADPATRVILVGAGGASWRQALGPRVHALGVVQHDHLLAAACAAADVALVPSLAENMPNTAIEAMACGIPVAGYRAGGMEDAVTDGETGRLVALGDRGQLGDALTGLLADEAVRCRMGEAARRRAERDFNAIEQAQRFAALYADLTGMKQ